MVKSGQSGQRRLSRDYLAADVAGFSRSGARRVAPLHLLNTARLRWVGASMGAYRQDTGDGILLEFPRWSMRRMPVAVQAGWQSAMTGPEDGGCVQDWDQPWHILIQGDDILVTA